MILTTLLALGDAHACDDSGLRNAISAAENAFRTAQTVRSAAPRGRELAGPGERALEDLEGSLACLEEPVSPALAARIHAADALVAWLAGDRARGLASLRAMLTADPRHDLPLELVPAEHGLRHWLADAGEREATWSPSLGRWALVDGLPTRAVPLEQPYVLQHPRDVGALRGRLVGVEQRAGGKTPWLVGGAALAAAAAGSYAGAWAVRGSYWDAVEARDNDRIGSLHTTTNVLSIGAVGAGTLGVVALGIGFTR